MIRALISVLPTYFISLALSCLILSSQLLVAAFANSSQLTPPLQTHEVSDKAQLLLHVDQRQFDASYFGKLVSKADPKLTEMAIQGAGRIGGDQVVKFIASQLPSESTQIRRICAFSFGLSGSKQAIPLLWEMLAQENASQVKQEIYLALGKLGQNDIIKRLLDRYPQEKDPQVIASIFQALSFAVTYHPAISDNIDMRKSQSVIDFSEILSLLEGDDPVAYQAGYFLARIKNIQKRISPAQLQKFTRILKNTNTKKVFAKLIGKVAKRNHLANRRLLSWLIEQSEVPDVGLATESIRAMRNLLYIPQAKIQLGKLQASKKTIIAQTALKALAESNLEGREITSLLRKQLKSDKPALVVEAISGLLKRQDKDEMSWAMQILSHKEAYVQIRFAQMLHEKDPNEFQNVLKLLAKNKNKSVSSYAKSLLLSGDVQTSKTKAVEVQSASPMPLATYDLNHSNLDQVIVTLTTSKGPIKIQLNNRAFYTGLNFIRLAKQGYYDGTYFSRVIGNFVAQGGDNIGNGEGGSKLTIREELSYLTHSAATIGMATSGKDTGDAQFFINLADNTHLDRHYTVFGQVIDGMSNALSLVNGDIIISASVNLRP